MKTVKVLDEHGNEIGIAQVYEAVNPPLRSTGGGWMSWHADITLNSGETFKGVEISIDPLKIDHIVRKKGEYVAVPHYTKC